MTNQYPAVAYSITVRAEYPNKPGMLGKIASTVGKAGGDIGAIDIVESARDYMVRDITINARNVEHGQKLAERIRSLKDVRVVNVSDPTFLLHLGGKIETHSKVALKTRNDLSMAYTPGVARVCTAINEDPSAVWTLTTKSNTVAVVTDGTAVLGLGDIGPAAAMPVMEGKAMLFKEFAGVDAWPICLGTKDPEAIIRAVKNIAPSFGGINLEDIAAPKCFYVEDRLKEELDIPVLHDDQHCTAVVVLAAVFNTLKLVGKRIEDIKIVVAGAGAAGVASAKLLKEAGATNIIGYDREGILHRGMDFSEHAGKEWFAQEANPEDYRGDLMGAMEGADLFIGVSGPGVITVEHLKKMNRDAAVFAMANPNPEIAAEEAVAHVRVVATGRSDYPNQINNVLAFPGFFRGLLDARAREVNSAMKIAAAKAIADTVPAAQLHEEYIIPSVFDKSVARAVAREVAAAAHRTGVASRLRRRSRVTALTRM